MSDRTGPYWNPPTLGSRKMIEESEARHAEEWAMWEARMEAATEGMDPEGCTWVNPDTMPEAAAALDRSDDELRDWLAGKLRFASNAKRVGPKVICWLVRELVKKEAMR